MARLRFNWGTGIAAAYLLFAASTLGFVVFALNRPVDLVSADYYEQSLVHDGRQAATARAAALGTGLRVETDAPAAALVFALPLDAAAGARGTITFYRPSDARADRVVAMTLDAGGRQRVPLGGLARGRWLVRLAWTAAGKAYFHEEALIRP
jgi:hypothetical protein